MKCRVCGKQANIRLPQYNRALCSDDFILFFEKRVAATIRKYKLIGEEEKTLVAVSGGKDSLSLWQLLNGLGYSADGIYIDLGIHEYSSVSFEKTKAMAGRLGRTLYSFSLAEAFTKGIKDLSGIMKRPPCSLCGSIKRYVMNRACIEHGYSVLATGHNLDDEASALLGNLLHWKEEYLWKKGVCLDAEGSHLARKVKPLFLCSEKEAAAYAVMTGIDYVYEECPYSVGASTLLYKGLLNRAEEESPATKLVFMKGYLKRARQGGLAKEERGPKSLCSACGYPSYAQTCNFCRLMERFGTTDTPSFRIHTHFPS
jgi:uncharacterized protein (TIGR00269 family)